jgi:hypothetical protein
MEGRSLMEALSDLSTPVKIVAAAAVFLFAYLMGYIDGSNARE